MYNFKISSRMGMVNMPEVVITGLGPVAPNGIGIDQFWGALKAGKSGIRQINSFGTSESGFMVAGEIPREEFAGYEPFEESKGAWCSYLIKNAAYLALRDAQVTKKEFSQSPSGIRVGVSTIDMEVGEREYELFKADGSTKSTVVADSFPHAAASEIARELKCTGKVLTFSSACSSGLVSIISAAESILKGEAAMILAGGGDAPLTPFLVSCFTAAGLHPAPGNGDPSTSSKPFDLERNGGVMAEGAGMVLLESAEHAQSRGAKIYARITGWGIANAISPLNLKQSYVKAMSLALSNTTRVDYISAHAPGIKLTDRVEVEAIKEIFGSSSYNIPIGSIKSMIGNPLSASGPLQVIATSRAIRDKFIPPTINYHSHDPHCDLDFIPNKGRVARVKTALVNSLGIGGCVASLVIEEP
jgi:3-oxoacyl-[acyl-carrier-protein] synthase II